MIHWAIFRLPASSWAGRGARLATLAVVGLAVLAACGAKPAPKTQAGHHQAQAGNLIKNSAFEGQASLPWNSSFTAPARGELQLNDSALCLTIEDGGQNNWDAQIRHREMVAEQGHVYTTGLRIWADRPTLVRAKVGMAGPPYKEYWHQMIQVGTSPQEVRGGFVMDGPTDPTIEFALHMGGSLLRDVPLPITICVDDVLLTDPQFTPSQEESTAPLSSVRVNQLGYLPGSPKVAVLVSDATSPLRSRP